MSAHAPDPNPEDGTARAPTTDRYAPYRYELTADGDAIIYDVDHDNRWLQATETLSLEDWR